MRLLLAILIPLTLLGCSTSQEPLPQYPKIKTSTSEFPAQEFKIEKPNALKNNSDILPKNQPPKLPSDEVQLLWQVPTEPVEKYVIYFGWSKDKLDQKVEIPLASLQKIEDPRFGAVYKYLLPDIPVDRTVYVSIAAIHGDIISQPGQVIELKPE